MPRKKAVTGFRFRAKELIKASEAAKRVMDCFLCGAIAKRGSHKKDISEDRKPMVGCRNNQLVGKLLSNPSLSTAQQLNLVASYYTRLAEHFDLAGQHEFKLQFKDRVERGALKAIVYQSFLTTLEAHFNIGKSKLIEKFGHKPGGYPVPDEDRPALYRSDNKSFRPFQCVRTMGCVISPRMPEKQPLSKVHPVLEYAILNSVSKDGTNRTFRTLKLSVPQMTVEILRQLEAEGKLRLDDKPNRPNSSVTGLGKRRLLYLEKYKRKWRQIAKPEQNRRVGKEQ